MAIFRYFGLGSVLGLLVAGVFIGPHTPGPTLTSHVEEILLPGELEWRRMQEKRAEGVPLDPYIYAELEALAERMGVSWPFE